jgi:periplasmic protein TonB
MRVLVSATAGVVVALLLFLLMQALIGGRDGFRRGTDGGQLVEFVRVRPEEVVQVRDRTVPRKPPPPDKPPPPPRLQAAAPQETARQALEIEIPDLSLGLSGGPVVATGWQAGDIGADGEVIPIVRIEPTYPREALLRGLEGWVELRFTINPDGSVSNPTVIRAQPPRVFDREATRAILRWKFRPRIVDGQAVARQAEQIIEFKIEREP